MKKYCTKCGHEFNATGREVICPACKAQVAEETKRAAVLRAKSAAWNGESVPARISGRASTVIREYGAVHNLPFAAALDALLQASTFFQSSGKAWDDITPYKSRRRDKHTTEDETDKQDVQDEPVVKPVKPVVKPVKPVVKPVKQAAKKAVKTASKVAKKAADAGKGEEE